jgi:hypothetical protein
LHAELGEGLPDGVIRAGADAGAVPVPAAGAGGDRGRLPIPDREICVIRRRLGSDSVAAAGFIERLREAMQKEGRRRSVTVRG